MRKDGKKHVLHIENSKNEIERDAKVVKNNARIWYNQKTVFEDGITTKYRLKGFYPSAREAKAHREEGFRTYYCTVPEFIKFFLLSQNKIENE